MLYHNAMISLAVYEAFTPAGKLAHIDDIVWRVATRILGRLTVKEKYSLGNSRGIDTKSERIERKQVKLKPKNPTTLCLCNG